MNPLRLELCVLKEKFAICRLDPKEAIPRWAREPADFYSITRTREELSIVCPEYSIPADVQAERGWKALKIQEPLPLSLIGVLASLLKPLSGAGISVFTLSTYDTDYILVKDEKLAQTLNLLGSICRIP